MLRSPSAVVLIAANLVPLYGVFAHGWDPFTLLLVYWFESAILGLLNLPRMWLAGGGDEHLSGVGGFVGKIFISGFFCVHYGMFMFGHLFFLSLLGELHHRPANPMEIATHALRLVNERPELRLPVIGLAISHVLSFFVNDVAKKELARTPPPAVMTRIYGRIIIMHVTVLAGGFFMSAVGAGRPLVAALVFIKTPIDLVMHLRQHGAQSFGRAG